MLYPPDATTHEVNDMHLLYFQALEKMQPEFEVTVIGRITEEQFRKTVPTTLKYVDFFQSGFTKEMSDVDISEAEHQTGMPFNFMFMCNQRRWSWYDKSSIKKAARYVSIWRTLLAGTDVLVTTLDNLYFIYTAEGVAAKLGIKIIKPLKGRLVDDGVVFWDKDNLPIMHEWQWEQESPAYKSFINRAVKKAQVRIHTSGISSTSGLAGRMLNIPKKILSLASNSRSSMDADIPSLHRKYDVLGSMALQMLLYPMLHSCFYSRPQQGECYFLFPLHFEWEANLAFREPFLNQIRTARHIADSLPHGTYLYVKPHPHWKNCDQWLAPMFFLKHYSDKIRILPPSLNTADLIRDSIGVIAINSTVGYEALHMKKPLIVLGHEWFKEAGVDIKDLNELPKALMAVAAGEYDVKHNDLFLRRYAANLTMTGDIEKFTKDFKSAIMKVNGDEIWMDTP
jgi:hypothetical protein